MKCGRLAVVMVLLGLVAAPSAMAWDFGVSVNVGRTYVYDPVVVERVYTPPVVSYVEPVTVVEPVTYVAPAVVETPVYTRTVIYDRPRVVSRAYSVGYYSPCRTSVVVGGWYGGHHGCHRTVVAPRPYCHGTSIRVRHR